MATANTILSPNIGTTDQAQGTLPIAEYHHPLSIAAMLVLALNDHWLKGSGLLPGWLTGKLSDVAGLIFFPLLLTALWKCGRLLLAKQITRRTNHCQSAATPIRLTPAQLHAALLIAGSAFAVLQFSPLAVQAYIHVTQLFGIPSQVTQDPTDLLALPALVIPYFIGRCEMRY